MEFIFSSFSPALNFEMKFSALVFTSGLGQNNGDGGNGVRSPPPSAAVGVTSESNSSRSGDPERELSRLSILT
nr:hypothetical protein MIMGU_mgv1a0137732mg [Ipomoea trifida]